MKQIFTTAILILFSLPLMAQNQSQSFVQNDALNFNRSTQTLLSGATSYGGFGSLIYGVSHINGQSVFMDGRRFGLIINIRPEHSINLVYANYRSGSDFDPASWNIGNVTQPQMEMSYSGFELEYVNRTRNLVHFGGQLLIGSGSIQFDNRNILVEKTKDNWLAIQPGINVNLNVTTWMRISAGGFYRFAQNVNLEGTSDQDLSGFSALFGIRFGHF